MKNQQQAQRIIELEFALEQALNKTNSTGTSCGGSTEIENKATKGNERNNVASLVEKKKFPTDDGIIGSSKENVTSRKDWQEYRLGDWMGGRGRGNLGKMMKQPRFNETIAYEYASELSLLSNGTLLKNKMPKVYDKNLFCDIVHRRGREMKKDQLQWPQSGDLVIHLRMGDTLDGMMLLEEVEDAFEYGVSIIPSQIRFMSNPQYNTNGWWKYVKSKCYYENVLKKIREKEEATVVAASQASPSRNTMKEKSKKQRVFVIGSAIHVHKKYGTDGIVSRKFAALVKQFFVNQGYEVISRLDGLPDEDMVWMSHSSLFVAAGGGFSSLASDCVEYFGGIAFRPSIKVGGGLEQSCWSEPRPDIEMKNYSWEKVGWRGRNAWNGIKSYPPDETIW